MKVLHVDTEADWRGGQAQVYNLLTHMKDLRVKNHLLTLPGSELQARLRKAEAPVTINNHKLRGEWDLSAAWKLQRLHDKYEFDLIHAHSSRALGITWLASLFFSLPPFIETRRLETPVAQNWFSEKKYGATDHHIANSETVRETLLECGIPDDKITVIPSGIDFQKIQETEPDYELAEKLGLDPDRPIIGNVGALCEQKDQKTFLHAAVRVLEKHPEAQFIIAGEGELRGELKKLARKLGIENNVIFAGFVENIFGLMKTFDLFVLTSLYEGLCGTIMQAMACEVPVLSSKVKGSKQILHSQENCATVPIGAIEKFAKKIKIFLNNPKEFNNYIENAQNTAKKFDYTKLSQSLYNFYKNLLNEVVKK